MQSRRLSTIACQGRVEIVLFNENTTALVNNLNEYFASVGSVTAQKALDLAIEHNFDIHPTI